jgi:hypothetical protein
MNHRIYPEVAGAVQARLAYLRRRKAILDEMIRCLELYAIPELAVPQQDKNTEESRPPMVGAL